MLQRGCELCEGVAALYCAADKAHICWTCDAKVHSANFLVARHTRSVLCTTCATPTPWRASGANPTPLVGLCASCSQGESQGECTTGHNNGDGGSLNNTRRAAGVVFNSRAAAESGCSSSSNNAERCDGKVVEGKEDVSPCPSESVYQLRSTSSEDVEGSVITVVDSRDYSVVPASVSSRISQSLKRKTLASCSPGGVETSKQIATTALEDVNRSVPRGRCGCANATTSTSSGIRRSDTHAHQDTNSDTSSGTSSGTSCEARDCSRSRQGESCATVLLAFAKRQRMDVDTTNRARMRPAGSFAAVSTSRLMRLLAKWHWDLHLSSPGTVPLALRMFREVSRALAPAVLSTAGMRVTLAACLRLAAGLDEAQSVVPKASEVAACAGVSTRRLAMTEIHLLALLGWRRFPMWAGVRD